MRFALMIEAQMGLSYEDQLGDRPARRGRRLRGVLPERPLRELPGQPEQATTDAWAVLAGLARETSTIRLGALVSPVTFRHPGNFAKLVTTVDEMSGGRIEVGVGAGWNDEDHSQLGLAFPGDRGARRPHGGPARAPARPLGRSRTAGTTTATRSRSGAARCGRGRSQRRGPTRSGRTAARGRRIITGGQGSPRGYRLAAQLRRRVQRLVVLAGIGRREAAGARRGLPRHRPRPEDADPLGDGRRAHRARRGGGRDVAPTQLLRGVRRAGGERRSMAERRAAAAGSSGRRTRLASMVQRFADGRHRADHAPGLRAPRPRHDRPARARS